MKYLFNVSVLKLREREKWSHTRKCSVQSNSLSQLIINWLSGKFVLVCIMLCYHVVSVEVKSLCMCLQAGCVSMHTVGTSGISYFHDVLKTCSHNSTDTGCVLKIILNSLQFSCLLAAK